MGCEWIDWPKAKVKEASKTMPLQRLEQKQKREHVVKCEAFDDIDTVFAGLESWRTKKLTSAENILFRDLGQKRNRTLGEKSDPRELKMLEKERRAYISCVVAGQKDLLPRELTDAKAFEARLDERLRKTTIKKKKKEDGQADGKPPGQEGVDEAEDESNLFESEESEETDDYNVNNYDDGDDDGDDGDDGEGDYGGGDY